MLIEIKVPDIGTDEIEVTELLVSVGEHIEYDQPLIVAEGNKASIEVPSPLKGKCIIKNIKVQVGDKIKTGTIIMICDEMDNKNQIINTKSKSENLLEEDKKEEKNINIDNIEEIHTTPAIRKLIRKLDIPLNNIKGTGRKGRILKEDIITYIKYAIKYLESQVQKKEKNKNIENNKSLLSNSITYNNNIVDEIELSNIKKNSGLHLQNSWKTVPHVTQFDEIDITELEKFRKQKNIDLEKRKIEVKISLLVFIIKTISKALEEMPHFNSYLSDNGKKIILNKYINIGIAVDTKNGLLVPVLRDVNKKYSIVELSKELDNLIQKARTGKLCMSEMQHGCFTISSLGSIGGTSFTPIVNIPEVAILGISKSSIKPIWNGNEFVPRLILPLSLSYDHRVIDGAEGARFISLIKEILSEIRNLLM